MYMFGNFTKTDIYDVSTPLEQLFNRSNTRVEHKDFAVADSRLPAGGGGGNSREVNENLLFGKFFYRKLDENGRN